jgi:hypothetical protein
MIPLLFLPEKKEDENETAKAADGKVEQKVTEPKSEK